MTKNKKINTDEELVKAQEKMIAEEAVQFEKQISSLIKEGKKEEAEKLLSEAVAKTGMTLQDIKNFKSAVENNLPLDPIVAQIVNGSLPIYLSTMLDETTMAGLYGILDDTLPVVNYENGNVIFDYQKGTNGDGIKPYYNSKTGQYDKIWSSDKFQVARETWMATLNFHKKAMLFQPLYTASHKTVALFVAQFNNLNKRMGEAFLQYHLALRGRILWAGDEGTDGILETEDSITFEELKFPDPDVEIQAKNGYEMVNKLNNLITSFRAPSAKHFDSFPNRKKQFELTDTEGNKFQLVRSLPENYEIITSQNFLNAYEIGVRAGAFNQDKLNFVSKAFKSIPSYDKIFGSEYANISGLKEDIITSDKDVISGSADLLLIVPDTYELIHQYTGTDTFRAGQLTQVINSFMKMGFAMKKYEDKFLLSIRITITPETTEPTPTLNSVENEIDYLEMYDKLEVKYKKLERKLFELENKSEENKSEENKSEENKSEENK